MYVCNVNKLYTCACVWMQGASEYMHVQDGDEIDRDRLIIMGTRLLP